MMKHFAPSAVRVEKDVVKRVIRKLKGKGQLNINVGQEVTPADIIGTSTVSAGFRTLNLAGSLGVAGPEAGKYLTRKIGQRIYQGELLAFKKNLLFGKKGVNKLTNVAISGICWL